MLEFITMIATILAIGYGFTVLREKTISNMSDKEWREFKNTFGAQRLIR